MSIDLIQVNNHYEVLQYHLNGTPTNGIRINTNIPFTNGSQMPSLMLEGYNYGTSTPIEMTLSWYVYNGQFYNQGVITGSAWQPDVYLGVENGKVVIFIDRRDYYCRFHVRAFAKGMSEVAEWFEDWTASDAGVAGLSNVEIVPYRSAGGLTTDGAPRKSQAHYGGRWLWGGWSPVVTANQSGYQDRGWDTAFEFTAPDYGSGSGPAMDMTLHGNFGQLLYYNRESIFRAIFGWRVLVNGSNVGTRSTSNVWFDDARTNLGNESINRYQYRDIGSWHWVRNSVPAGASIEVQYRMRYYYTAMQQNGYGRCIAGVYRELTATFDNHKVIM